MIVDIILRLAEHAAHGIERTVAGDPGRRRHLGQYLGELVPQRARQRARVALGVIRFCAISVRWA